MVRKDRILTDAMLKEYPMEAAFCCIRLHSYSPNRLNTCEQRMS